eukprot:2620479-Pyramimonas_sp.AAC.1
MGLGNFEMKRVEAHVSWRLAEMHGASWCHHTGNKEADRIAKLGARLHPQGAQGELQACEA